MIESIIYKDRAYYRKPNHKDVRNHYFIMRCWAKKTGFEKYLHRQVWVDNFGKIEKHHVIHHKDENPGNNDISNLEKITINEHRNAHKEAIYKWANSSENKANLDDGRKYGIEWMKSEKGREHARSLGNIQKQNSMINKTCVVCGNEYTACDLIKKSIYCSRRCNNVASKRRKKTITCITCGKETEVSKYSKTRSCFGGCTAIAGHIRRKSILENTK